MIEDPHNTTPWPSIYGDDGPERDTIDPDAYALFTELAAPSRNAMKAITKFVAKTDWESALAQATEFSHAWDWLDPTNPEHHNTLFRGALPWTVHLNCLITRFNLAGAPGSQQLLYQKAALINTQLHPLKRFIQERNHENPVHRSKYFDGNLGVEFSLATGDAVRLRMDEALPAEYRGNKTTTYHLRTAELLLVLSTINPLFNPVPFLGLFNWAADVLASFMEDSFFERGSVRFAAFPIIKGLGLWTPENWEEFFPAKSSLYCGSVSDLTPTYPDYELVPRDLS